VRVAVPNAIQRRKNLAREPGSVFQYRLGKITQDFVVTFQGAHAGRCRGLIDGEANEGKRRLIVVGHEQLVVIDIAVIRGITLRPRLARADNPPPITSRGNANVLEQLLAGGRVQYGDRSGADGDRLRCGYHGLRYDATGKCIFIPGQTLILRRRGCVRFRGRALYVRLDLDG